MYTSHASAREVTFDTGILHSRGLSTDLNRYFAETPRYLPGVHSVQVVVNGKIAVPPRYALEKTARYALIMTFWILPG